MLKVVHDFMLFLQSLERDLMNYLNGLYPDGDPIVSQVHEPGHWLRIRGVFADDVAKYLLEKGF